MSKSKHCLSMVLLCVFLANTMLPSMHTTKAQEQTISEKAITFLEQVVELKLVDYNIKLDSIFNDVRETKVVVYILDSNESKIDAHFRFIEKDLVWCKLYSIKGSPIFNRPTSNTLDESKAFLDRYQNFTIKPHLKIMRTMLDNISSITPQTKTVNDIKLEILQIAENTISIRWTNSPLGIKNRHSAISLKLRDGVFESISDCWTVNEIGNTKINLDKNEAIEIAKELVQNYSMTLIAGVEVQNFTVADYDFAIRSELSMQPREDNTLYPKWAIQLGLDKVYAGRITQFTVTLWADTGEIDSISPTGFYRGPLSEENQPTPTPIPTQSPSVDSIPISNPESKQPLQLPSTLEIVTIVILTVVALGLAVNLAKKRRS